MPVNVRTSGGKRVYNLEKILKELRKRRRVAEDQLSEIKIGYSAEHAVPVHERLNVYHRVGQAKFLEQPLRTEQKAMALIIRSRLRARVSLIEAQMDAAKHLMKISLQLVPVDEGTLKDSWFIKSNKQSTR